MPEPYTATSGCAANSSGHDGSCCAGLGRDPVLRGGGPVIRTADDEMGCADSVTLGSGNAQWDSVVDSTQPEAAHADHRAIATAQVFDRPIRDRAHALL